MQQVMVRVSHVTKEYRLGQIGGTTLKEELQRLGARMRHREDPTRKIGAPDPGQGGPFLALNDVSFDVMKGERLGIIGRNGAGKSTLLKLISRITTPTKGDIYLDGRVTSMLEVGTGFHGELTGRENIYLNGAILGMKKREIDERLEDIIDFSECRPFIDTPVKRYSSGMYVKLAFSVAAHLDSEIMIMDEVLAVGDMAFQKKCLDKMNAVSRKQGRTILYVSHNMDTIRRLCSRCMVLEGGRIVYDGEVEGAIDAYMGTLGRSAGYVDLESFVHISRDERPGVRMTSIECLDREEALYDPGSVMKLCLSCRAFRDMKDVFLRVDLMSAGGVPLTMMTAGKGVFLQGGRGHRICFDLDISRLVPGCYLATLSLYSRGDLGQIAIHDRVRKGFSFEIRSAPGFNGGMVWKTQYWGHFYNEPFEMCIEGERAGGSAGEPAFDAGSSGLTNQSAEEGENDI